jgi:aldehyde:ferredoxin oxidoreductase
MKDYYREKTLSKDDVMRLLDDYYDERGWDEEKGVPTKEKISELGLAEYTNQE